jgi:glutamate racemase
VLGCTHYPFVLPLIERVAQCDPARTIAIVDTGEPIARQLVRLLTERAMLHTESEGSVSGFTTGSETSLSGAFASLLGMQPLVTRIAG